MAHLAEDADLPAALLHDRLDETSNLLEHRPVVRLALGKAHDLHGLGRARPPRQVCELADEGHAVVV